MRDVTVYAIPAFVLTMILEGVVLARRGNPYETKDTAASLSGGIGSVVVKAIVGGFIGLLYSFIYQHRIFTLGTGVLAWAVLLFAEDLCYYAYHRTSHGVRLFWAGHIVHHSSTRYTLGTALRQSWTAPIFGSIFWMPLPFLGFRPEMIALMSGLNLIYQYWIHTETIRTLGPLEWVLNTPSHHRVHHGSNDKYLDKNHAGIFIIWDRLFGTFQKEEEQVVYGLTKNVESFHPVWIQVHELVAMGQDVVAAPTWRQRFRAVFASPASLALEPCRGETTDVPDVAFAGEIRGLRSGHSRHRVADNQSRRPEAALKPSPAGLKAGACSGSSQARQGRAPSVANVSALPGSSRCGQSAGDAMSVEQGARRLRRAWDARKHAPAFRPAGLVYEPVQPPVPTDPSGSRISRIQIASYSAICK